MADTFLYQNNAVSTLAVGVSAIATSFVLSAGEGGRFPAPGANQRFPVTLADAAGNIEICYCTARAGDTLTVIRNRESSGEKIWQIGDVIELRVTAGVLQQILQADAILLVDTNCDMVDGIHAFATATPAGLLALDASAILQATVANALLLEGNNSAFHLARANHTGTQLLSTISDVGTMAGVNNVGELITATGNFTVPSGVETLNIVMCGGGGGGGSGGLSDTYGGGTGWGGRAGRTAVSLSVNVMPGAVIPITIGAGGVANAVGGTSTFLDSPGPLAGTVDAATQSDPVVITDTAHGLTTGDMITITGVGGMTEINGRDFIVTVLTANTFELDDEDGTGHGTFTAAGLWAKFPPIEALGGENGLVGQYGGTSSATSFARHGENYTPYGHGGNGVNGFLAAGENGTYGSGGGGGGPGNVSTRGVGGVGGDGICWIYW